MGLFVYTQKGSIISTVDLPTTEIIEPLLFSKNRLTIAKVDDRIIELSHEWLVNRGTKKSFKKVLTRPSEDDRIIELSLEGLVNRGTKKSFKKVLTKYTRNDKLR
ncbi:hypothetical protein ACTGZN_11880 [Streptococcus suis]|uniref:hypothetical protein n=1 Tax=Streptococcus suis TaxID=1307 RepID=UPI0010A80933|nr:hypothetical protein [Streptococcus suis]QCE38193.1 hypothetical protein E8M06_02395 [Streptococcus suis]